jgi:uncharacterized membrane protein YqiK
MEAFLAQHRELLIIVGAAVVAVLLLRRSNMLRYIPNNRVGIVEKLWSVKGSVKQGFIALGGEAGFQPEVLRGGWHLMFPFQYRVHVMPLVTIAQGHIGYVFARDGQPLPPTQTLASNATAVERPGARRDQGRARHDDERAAADVADAAVGTLT